MHTSLERLNLIRNKVKEIVDKKQLKTTPKIIAVSKTFPFKEIIPLLDSGHIHFGENKIQEAEKKWSNVKIQYDHFQLHMLGKLQTNKAKKAVKLFDYIHSVDNMRLAKKIFQYEKELKKKVKLFIQVNVSGEIQKSGIRLNDLDNFYNFCTKEVGLNIVGLMCLPPANLNSNKYFKDLKGRCDKLLLKDISMGMSSDYEDAIVNGSTFIRLGTAIFGSRSV